MEYRNFGQLFLNAATAAGENNALSVPQVEAGGMAGSFLGYAFLGYTRSLAMAILSQDALPIVGAAFAPVGFAILSLLRSELAVSKDKYDEFLVTEEDLAAEREQEEKDARDKLELGIKYD